MPEQPGHCPFLGLKQNRAIRFASPTPEHRCYVSGSPLEIPVDQSNYCLSQGHIRCPLYTGLTDPTTPPVAPVAVPAVAAPAASQSWFASLSPRDRRIYSGMIAALSLIALLYVLFALPLLFGGQNGTAANATNVPAASPDPCRTDAARCVPTATDVSVVIVATAVPPTELPAASPTTIPAATADTSAVGSSPTAVLSTPTATPIALTLCTGAACCGPATPCTATPCASAACGPTSTVAPASATSAPTAFPTLTARPTTAAPPATQAPAPASPRPAATLVPASPAPPAPCTDAACCAPSAACCVPSAACCVPSSCPPTAAPAPAQPLPPTAAPAQPVVSVSNERVTLYFGDVTGTLFVPTQRLARVENGQVATAAVRELIAGPRSGLQPLLFPDVRLLGVRIADGTAYVNVDRALTGQGDARGYTALTLTLTEFSSVQRVVVQVNGQTVNGPLTRTTVNPINPAGLAADPSQTSFLPLYFLSTDGVHSVRVIRMTPKTYQPAEQTVRALLAGPGSYGYALQSPIPGGTELRGIRIDNGVAIVDFTAPFLEANNRDLAVRSVAQSLTTLPSVRGVLILVEGENVAKWWGDRYGQIVARPAINPE